MVSKSKRPISPIRTPRFCKMQRNFVAPLIQPQRGRAPRIVEGFLKDVRTLDSLESIRRTYLTMCFVVYLSSSSITTCSSLIFSASRLALNALQGVFYTESMLDNVQEFLK